MWKKVRAIGELDPRKQKTKGYNPDVYVAAITFSLTSGATAGRGNCR
jgi:hypothetical protein